MPKFDLDINGQGQGAAQERQAWAGELPPTGSYEGILKVLALDVISQNSAQYAGKTKMRIGVELRNTPGGLYDGYIAWGNLNLIDPSIPFVNQFLLSLTDGSQKQQEAIEKAFYQAKPDVDERKKHILKIGRWNVNSPNGELPIKVSISNKPFTNTKVNPPVTTQQVRIESYLLGGGAGAVSNGSPEEVPEEEQTVLELEPEDLDADESILDA